MGGGEFKSLPIQHIDDWTLACSIQYHASPSHAQPHRHVREYLQEYDEDKWGFIIFHTCYYDDQERWNQFMERLKDFARTNILSPTNNREGGGAAIIDLLEWNVQEDPAMEGCSFGEVRR